MKCRFKYFRCAIRYDYPGSSLLHVEDKPMISLRNALIPIAVLLVLPWTASLADDPSVAPIREPGIWQTQKYNFQFLGFTTTYSCDGLADKIKVLLIAAGARADSKAQPGACSRGFGRPDKFASATLTFYTLAPVGTAAGGVGPRVVGTWRSVIFASRSPRQLEVGDCELVEQFRTNVLPMFTTRNIDDRVTCVPHQQSGSVINLKFESFAAVPAKAAAARDERPAPP
jgi:hypothetical protein